MISKSKVRTKLVSFCHKKISLAREQDKAVQFDHDYQLIKSYINLTVHYGFRDSK